MVALEGSAVRGHQSLRLVGVYSASDFNKSFVPRFSALKARDLCDDVSPPRSLKELLWCASVYGRGVNSDGSHKQTAILEESVHSTVGKGERGR